MRRRDFIKGIVGSATALPLAARAQPREQKPRVAVLMGGLLSDDLGGQAEAAALEAGLTELGWKLGGNILLEYHWPGAELDQVTIAANEIVAMRPDLVVSRFGRWQMAGALEGGRTDGLEGLAVIQSRDRAFRGGLPAISRGGGASGRHNRCFCRLRQCGKYRKCV